MRQIALISFYLFLSTVCAEPFIKALDISYLPEIEASGGLYSVEDEPKDFFEIISAAGINTVRIRLWNNHTDGEASFDNYISLAKRAKQHGLKILLNFHYSDTWADPGNQQKPVDWQALDFPTLKNELKHYTESVIRRSIEHGIYPDYVQPGNEISVGFLWDTGRIGGGFDNNWPRFAELLNAAITGIKAADSEQSIQIILHHHTGADFDNMNWFFWHVSQLNIDYDIIGVSYYAFFSNQTVQTLSTTIKKIQHQYQKPIFVLETAYPWTTEWADDTHNVFGSQSPLLKDFPASPLGQQQYLSYFLDEMKNAGVIGVAYWGAEWIPTPDHGSMWENLTLFDFQGNALPGLLHSWK